VATVTYGRLLRNTMAAAMQAADPILPVPEGGYGGYNILTDS
jgi:hypothetical protein